MDRRTFLSGIRTVGSMGLLVRESAESRRALQPAPQHKPRTPRSPRPVSGHSRTPVRQLEVNYMLDAARVSNAFASVGTLPPSVGDNGASGTGLAAGLYVRQAPESSRISMTTGSVAIRAGRNPCQGTKSVPRSHCSHTHSRVPARQLTVPIAAKLQHGAIEAFHHPCRMPGIS